MYASRSVFEPTQSSWEFESGTRALARGSCGHPPASAGSTQGRQRQVGAILRRDRSAATARSAGDRRCGRRRSDCSSSPAAAGMRACRRRPLPRRRRSPRALRPTRPRRRPRRTRRRTRPPRRRPTRARPAARACRGRWHSALDAKKTVVILFWNKNGVDDRSVKKSVDRLSRRGGEVAKFTDTVKNLVALHAHHGGRERQHDARRSWSSTAGARPRS